MTILKNHEMVNGQLLQTNKKYSQLKMKQKDKISGWMYEETKAYYERTGILPMQGHEEEVIDAVYDRILDSKIWIPYDEVADHYYEKRSKLSQRIRREELGLQPPEKARLMTRCMICRGEEVLVMDKIIGNRRSLTFPGGYVKHGEIFSKALIREVYDVTGLMIKNPVLRGIYHWHSQGVHNIGLMYRATEFEGELRPSDNGGSYWISRHEFGSKPLAVGIPKVLEILDGDNITECYMKIDNNGSRSEQLF